MADISNFTTQSLCPPVLRAGAPVLCVALALAGCGARAPAEPELVIVSPHRDEIRIEFGRAFRQWYQRQTGRPARVTWLVPGGTSTIQRYLVSQFEAVGNPGIDLM
ncbi:MAG: hypothetical protein ACOC46_02515, partial [Pirellulales bacterium]